MASLGWPFCFTAPWRWGQGENARAGPPWTKWVGCLQGKDRDDRMGREISPLFVAQEYSKYDFSYKKIFKNTHYSLWPGRRHRHPGQRTGTLRLYRAFHRASLGEEPLHLRDSRGLRV